MAKPEDLPPIEILKELFRYEPETGILRHRIRSVEHFRKKADCDAWNTKYAGEFAGYLNESGYRIVFIWYKKRRISIAAARVCFAIHYGWYPKKGVLRHANKVTYDNRIENLHIDAITEGETK